MIHWCLGHITTRPCTRPLKGYAVVVKKHRFILQSIDISSHWIWYNYLGLVVNRSWEDHDNPQKGLLYSREAKQSYCQNAEVNQIILSSLPCLSTSSRGSVFKSQNRNIVARPFFLKDLGVQSEVFHDNVAYPVLPPKQINGPTETLEVQESCKMTTLIKNIL